MFGKTLRMELSRAFRPFRMLVVVAAIVILLLGSDWNLIHDLMEYGFIEFLGIADKLEDILTFDTFKCVFVILLAGLYTNSFCKDDNSKYLRMILSRVDVTTYTQCRFLANLCVVLVVSISCFYLCAVCMSPVMPLIYERNILYYIEIAESHPILYIGMCGYMMGLVAAASSSVGLLFSVYKSNSFVSIGISGLVFFVAISYIPLGTPFNVLRILSMNTTIGYEAPWQLMFLWANVYMLSVIGICGILFYRRMKWRVANGFL